MWGRGGKWLSQDQKPLDCKGLNSCPWQQDLETWHRIAWIKLHVSINKRSNLSDFGHLSSNNNFSNLQLKPVVRKTLSSNVNFNTIFTKIRLKLLYTLIIIQLASLYGLMFKLHSSTEVNKKCISMISLFCYRSLPFWIWKERGKGIAMSSVIAVKLCSKECSGKHLYFQLIV